MRGHCRDARGGGPGAPCGALGVRYPAGVSLPASVAGGRSTDVGQLLRAAPGDQGLRMAPTAADVPGDRQWHSPRVAHHAAAHQETVSGPAGGGTPPQSHYGRSTHRSADCESSHKPPGDAILTQHAQAAVGANDTSLSASSMSRRPSWEAADQHGRGVLYAVACLSHALRSGKNSDMQKGSPSENQLLMSHGLSILGKWIKSSSERILPIFSTGLQAERRPPLATCSVFIAIC